MNKKVQISFLKFFNDSPFKGLFNETNQIKENIALYILDKNRRFDMHKLQA